MNELKGLREERNAQAPLECPGPGACDDPGCPCHYAETPEASLAIVREAVREQQDDAETQEVV